MLELANKRKILKRSVRQLQASSPTTQLLILEIACSIIDERVEEICFHKAKWFDHKQVVLLIDL